MQDVLDQVKQKNEIEYLKHDLCNHINVIKIYLEIGMTEKGLEYINKISDKLENCRYTTITGNVDIDIILSAKLQKISSIGTKISMNSNVPSEIDISNFDLIVIFGNLLDNAYEALISAIDKKLELEINYIEDSLYIKISNSHSNNIKIFNGKIVTSKRDKENHGIGFSSVKNCINDNGGKISVEYTKDRFNVFISIPCKA